MHAVQISFFVDPQRRPPAQLLHDWYALGDIAAAVVSTGVDVTVIQASTVPGELVRDGVRFVFLPPDAAGVPLAHSASFDACLSAEPADVFHVHGLGFARDVLALRASYPGLPIILQDHADRPPRWWHRREWRRGAAAADGIAFCACEQAVPFERAGLLASTTEIFQIPESTSSFEPGDRAGARAATGLHGDPALLWVGHLDDNKDPLTVLEGVSNAVNDLPGLELWCCFGSAPLRAAVETRIERDVLLRDRVKLLGRVPHAQVELLMRAADLFVLGSHREGSSFSLIEALATGLTPVVTDIPSLRALTGDGAVGALWRCGDARACGAALRRAAATLGTRSRAAVRAHFDAHLGSAALGRKLATAYCELVGARAFRVAS